MNVPLMTHLNIYADLSMGTLNTSEQTLYFRLCLLKIKLGWKIEWFGATNQRLCAEMSITEKTLIDTRNKLKQKGFIDFIPGKKGMVTRYKILPITRELYWNNSSLFLVNDSYLSRL